MRQTKTPMMPLATLAGAALLLSACTMAAPVAAPRPAPVMPAPGPVMGAAGAENACIAAGQERGLQVLGVAGSREVVSPTGEVMRDVMLRVSRGGAQIEVRCNYQSATGLARIMLI